MTFTSIERRPESKIAAFYLPVGLHDQVKAAANQERVSLSSLVRQVLEEFITQYDTGDAKNNKTT